MRRPKGSRAATSLPFMEMMHSLWVVISASADTRGLMKSWLGKALGCNGDGCLAATEHEAGIEQVTGHRLGSGHRYGSGREFGFGY